jgi:hypothetical protein
MGKRTDVSYGDLAISSGVAFGATVAGGALNRAVNGAWDPAFNTLKSDLAQQALDPDKYSAWSLPPSWRPWGSTESVRSQRAIDEAYKNVFGPYFTGVPLSIMVNKGAEVIEMQLKKPEEKPLTIDEPCDDIETCPDYFKEQRKQNFLPSPQELSPFNNQMLGEF